MKVVDKATGKEVKIGQHITSFRGLKAVFRGIEQEPSPGKSGKIRTDGGTFYPQVFNLEIVD